MRFLVLLWVALIGAETALACEGRGPDPWFEVTVSFDEKQLPKGVRLIRKGSIYFLANSTAKELLALRPVADSKMRTVRSKMKLDPDFIHEYKSVSGKAFRCVMESDPNCWTPEVAYDQFAPGAVEAVPYPELKQVYRDGRAKDVAVPPAHPVAIYFQYAGKKSKLAGQAEYKLNSKYDAKAGEKGARELLECEAASEGKR